MKRSSRICGLVKGGLSMIISHPYIIIKRKIHHNVQHLIEFEETLILHEDKVTSASDDFKLIEVLDMSFKSMSGGFGFLYLHTIRGLYSYHTKENPEKFINIYKHLK